MTNQTKAHVSRTTSPLLKRKKAGSSHNTQLLIGAMLASLLLPTLASAQGAVPSVYHCPTSTECTNPGTPLMFAAASATIELFIAPGTLPTPVGQEVCLNGTGHEICGFTLEVMATGDLSITGFAPNMAAGTSVEGTDILSHIDPTTNALRISRINGLDGDSIELWLGTLSVSNSGNGGEIRLNGTSEAVSANLNLIAVNDNGPIAVPEPSFALSILLAGGALTFGIRKQNPRHEGIKR